MSQSSFPVGARSEGSAAKDWLSARSLRLLAAALALALVLVCAIQLTSSAEAAGADGQFGNLAELNAKVTALASALEAERDNTLWFIALRNGPHGVPGKHMSPAAASELQVVRQHYAYTDKLIAQVNAGMSAIGTDYPHGTVLSAKSVLAEDGFVPSVRHAALPAGSPLDVLARYSAIIYVLLGFEDQIASSNSDPQISATVSAMSQISRVEEEYSVQRGVIMYALSAGKFAPNMFKTLEASTADQSAAEAQFNNFASEQEVSYYLAALSDRPDTDRVRALEQSVVRYAPIHKELPGLGISPGEWFGSATQVIGHVRTVELRLNAEVQQRADGLQRPALIGVAVFSALVLLLMALVVVLLRPSIASLRRRRGVSRPSP
ncbi:MAG: nitrate- and nitrite sensing domain-containing protein [Nocardiopsaceae bacterium]|jgi:hypothetical protein|nr:nitrate- and nitrite sensing domain-containing protein [Nocardiopsaceae bacterium]